MITGTSEPDGTAVKLDTTLYLPDKTPAPAVLLAQGFGGDKSDLAGTAQTLAQHGYVALAYTARGFGNSGGLIHFDSPSFEVHDAKLLVDYLTTLPQVDKTKIAVAGSSYGGGLALLLAGYDQRIKAVAADITWNDLSHALFPNAAGNGPGVFKKLWAGTLFGNAFSANLGGVIDSSRAATRRACPRARCRAAGSHRTSAPRTRTPRRTALRTPRCARSWRRRARPRSSTASTRRPCSPRVSRTRCSASARPMPTRAASPPTARRSRSCGAAAATTTRPAVATMRPRRCSTGSAPPSARASTASSRSTSPSRTRCCRRRAGGCASRSARRRAIPASTAPRNSRSRSR